MNTDLISKVVPDTVEGVVISDEALEEMFVEEKPKPAIYGNIEPTEEIIEFLNIPTNFRTYSRIESINEEVRCEEAATHER